MLYKKKKSLFQEILKLKLLTHSQNCNTSKRIKVGSAKKEAENYARSGPASEGLANIRRFKRTNKSKYDLNYFPYFGCCPGSFLYS